MSSTYVCEHCGAKNHTQNILCNDCGRPLLYRQRRQKNQTTPQVSTPESPASRSNEMQILNNPVSSLPSRQHAVPPKQREEIIEVDLTQPETQYTAAQTIEFRSNRLQAEDYIENSTNKRGMLIGVLGVLILAVITLAVMLFMRNTTSAESEHFGLAEKYYLEHEYADALLAFAAFSEKYERSDLAIVAERRIEDIRQLVDGNPAHQQRLDQKIEHFMFLAERACKNKQFVMPEEDNAIQHIKNTLFLSPDHPRALQIRDAIVDFFIKKADVAFERRHYKDAISYYQAILSIVPEHALAIDRMGLLRDYM